MSHIISKQHTVVLKWTEKKRNNISWILHEKEQNNKELCRKIVSVDFELVSGINQMKYLQKKKCITIHNLFHARFNLWDVMVSHKNCYRIIFYWIKKENRIEENVKQHELYIHIFFTKFLISENRRRNRVFFLGKHHK